MKEYEELYDESVKLIDSNPNLTTEMIPNHLLNVWIYNGNIKPNPPSELLFAASIYRYGCEKCGNPTLDTANDCHQFERLQHLLATEYVCRAVGAKLSPRAIFNFTQYTKPLNIDIKRHQVKNSKSLPQN